MVAIRETHSASFDFNHWSEHLKLPVGEKALLHRTYALLMQRVQERAPAKSQVFSQISAEQVSILMELHMDLESLQVAVIYPACESGWFSKEEIFNIFGRGIADLLQSVRDMEALKFLQNLADNHMSDTKIDRVRRMLLSMVDDVRGVVIKLAERIAVIRAAQNAGHQVQTAIAKEIATIYAPLANRLGIGQLKWELEDLAFRFLHPKEYHYVASLLHERRIEREQYINNFVHELSDLLKQQQIKCEVYGRPKHIYSIWRKMQKKHYAFNQLFDIRAVRVIVGEVEECYAALGIVHTRWQHLQSEFDDYIANPKPNGYQSIHTVVLGDGGKPVEVQIRTEAMHRFAELGVAAHWRYKEGQGQGAGIVERINWLRKLLAWRDDMVAAGALRDQFKDQLFENCVYVFTPKGEVIDLPAGATPLDFAYHIHTMVGHRCIGARVNGQIVPYTYQLQTGDQVEIITQKKPNPSRDWINPDNGFLKSGKARSKVMSWFRKIDYDKNCAAGQSAVEAEAVRQALGLNKEQLASKLKSNLKRFNIQSVSDLFAGVGAGDIKLNQVISFLKEQVNAQKQAAPEIDLKQINASAAKLKLKARSTFVVAGMDSVLTHAAKCCHPFPGDKICGFITHGRGVSVHRADCRQFKHLAHDFPSRVVEAEWGRMEEQNRFAVTLRVVAVDYPGLLRDITTIVANEKINVLGVRSHVDRPTNTSIIDIDLMISKVEFLDRTINKIKSIKSVSNVQRL